MGCCNLQTQVQELEQSNSFLQIVRFSNKVDIASQTGVHMYEPHTGGVRSQSEADKQMCFLKAPPKKQIGHGGPLFSQNAHDIIVQTFTWNKHGGKFCFSLQTCEQTGFTIPLLGFIPLLEFGNFRRWWWLKLFWRLDPSKAASCISVLYDMNTFSPYASFFYQYLQPVHFFLYKPGSFSQQSQCLFRSKLY